MKKLIFASILAVWIAFLGYAIADQLTGVDGGYWSANRYIGITSTCIGTQTDAGTGACALFPAGDQPGGIVVTVTSTGGTCGFSLSDDAVLGDMVWTTSDRGAGGGAIFRFGGTNPTVWYQRPQWNYMRAASALTGGGAAGGAPGVCDVATVSAGEGSVYAPCSVTADCTSYGGGTCRTGSSITADMRSKVAVFLICRSGGSAGAGVTFRVSKGVVAR